MKTRTIKNNVLRFNIYLLWSIAAAVCAVSCGGGGESTPPSPAPSAQDKPDAPETPAAPDSPDGIPANTTSRAWEKVGELPFGMYGHKAAVMGGDIVIAFEHYTLTSRDGSEWNTSLSFSGDTAYQADYQFIPFNGKLWLTGGLALNSAGDFEAPRQVYYSNGSAQWEQWVKPALVSGMTGGIVRHTGFAFNNAMWIAGGITDNGLDTFTSTGNVWKSTDGINWTLQNTHGLSARSGHAGTRYNGYMWITGGLMSGGLTEYHDVLRSSDGESWSTVTSDPGWSKRNDHTLAANSTGMYLIGGAGGENGDFLNDVWHSSDGKTWTERSGAAFPARSGHASVIKDGYLYIIGGCNADVKDPV